ncbi:hypothetical protein [Pendulispora albinea]|uniref:Terminase n=1 Tax=Pendulispora albinea TaxID=2741071 RepID=A0ABZ2LWZ2_9BACT
MNVDALLAESRKRAARLAPLEIPARFVDFCIWLRVTLTPAQRVYSLVVYDGVQPADLDGEEREIARVIFDGIEHIPPIMLRRIFTLAGGRGGKTYVLGALRLLWGAFVRDLSTMAPGERAVALTIAPKDEQRQQVVNYQIGAMSMRPELWATIVWPRKISLDHPPSGFTIRRPDGQTVSFEASTCNRGGVGGRGRSFTDALMDEAAFFQDEKKVVNDKELFTAAAPRVLPGGQAIAQTTAWAKVGYHYEQWKQNFGHPVSGVAARATTEMLRPAAADIVALERANDPETARREFDAEPMAETATTFFSEELIESCLIEVPWFGTLAHADNPDIEKSAGSDMGFRSNSSALCITYRVLGMIVLGYAAELRPEPGKPLRVSHTVATFREALRARNVSTTMADGHYREAVVEHLGDLLLVDAPSPSDVAVRVRTLMRDGRVRLPDPRALPPEFATVVTRLVKQLKEVKGQATAGGGMTIHLPLWPDGSHGDIAAAFMLAVYQLYGEAAKSSVPKPGTPEWEEAERAKRRAALRAGENRLGIRR